ncbi:unnamed protein product [Ixodes pacificus]
MQQCYWSWTFFTSSHRSIMTSQEALPIVRDCNFVFRLMLAWWDDLWHCRLYLNCGFLHEVRETIFIRGPTFVLSYKYHENVYMFLCLSRHFFSPYHCSCFIHCLFLYNFMKWLR